MNKANQNTSYTEHEDVRLFQEKFQIPMSKVPALLDSAAFNFRSGFMAEELSEFIEAHTASDLIGAADALVDLAYVLHGTALMMGLPWELLWKEVQRANMAKERATHPGQSKRSSTLDVIKPVGWKGPNHAQFLGVSGWPVFNTVKWCDDEA